MPLEVRDVAGGGQRCVPFPRHFRPAVGSRERQKLSVDDPVKVAVFHLAILILVSRPEIERRGTRR